jgi:hypothetical protein
VAPRPAQVHGAIDLGAASIDDDRPVEDCSGAEGRAEAEVELPPHPTVFAEYEVDFTALGRLFVHLLLQSLPHLVVIDRTEWQVGQTPVDVLTIGGGTMEGRFRLFGAPCRAEAGLGRPTTPICRSSFSM